ncbi:thiamine pyrophosphate-dependent enzyme [Bordetella pertussis]|uniref:thiamine pyrophosphate-dependent enzyme n=1 Tax=Bordetella pertussis TaxID=520 RepID=UPI0039B76476
MTGGAESDLNIQELSTCHPVPPDAKNICLNNRFLGMVRQWQQIDYGSRYSESYMDSLPDFVRSPRPMATSACASSGPRRRRAGAVREAFKKHKDRLVFLDFITDRTEKRVAHGEGRPRDC